LISVQRSGGVFLLETAGCLKDFRTF